MKITLFTANQDRHNFFINQLSNICDELFVVQEVRTIFPGYVKGHYDKSKIMEKYFEKVLKAEKKIFGNKYVIGKNKNINIFAIAEGDLNFIKIKTLSKFLKSDLYIVFGSSYIKNDLVDFLIKKKSN